MVSLLMHLIHWQLLLPICLAFHTSVRWVSEDLVEACPPVQPWTSKMEHLYHVGHYNTKQGDNIKQLQNS